MFNVIVYCIKKIVSHFFLIAGVKLLECGDRNVGSFLHMLAISEIIFPSVIKPQLAKAIQY